MGSYENELSLSYEWLPNGASSSLPQGRQPLTTWYGSGSAYKTLAIDPPKGVKAGETWSLALYSNSGRSTSSSPAWKSDFVQVAHLGQDNSVWTPIPVLSEPIRFTVGSRGGPAAAPGKGKGKEKEKGKGNDKVDKQDRIRRTFVFPSAGADGPRELVLTEQTSFDLDKVRQVVPAGSSARPWTEQLPSHLRKSGTRDLPARHSSAIAYGPKPHPLLLVGSRRRARDILPLYSIYCGRQARSHCGSSSWVGVFSRKSRLICGRATDTQFFHSSGTGSGLVSIALASLLDQTDVGDKHQLYATDLRQSFHLSTSQRKTANP